MTENAFSKARMQKSTFQGSRQLPGQDVPAHPVHYGHQIKPAVSHSDIGNISTPDLIYPHDFAVSQKIWVYLMIRMGSAGI